jgi:hypothetical protein
MFYKVKLITILGIFLSFICSPLIAEDKVLSIHDAPAESCQNCHEEIFKQWQDSMHAQSSALKDPIHGAFYKNVMGSPTAVDLRSKKGKYPVCLKCHAPMAAIDKKTNLDAKQNYKDGITCVSCHSFKSFKGPDKANGKPNYGIDAYEIDTASLYGPSGETYSVDSDPKAKWPTPVNHPMPLQGNKSALFESNDICMGCHEKRSNFHGTPLCVTGKEIRNSKNFVSCQTCHMSVVTVPKLQEGKIVEGQYVTIADHTMAGGHDERMVRRGLAMDMDVKKEGDTIKAAVTVKNRLPHSFPTGAPFRNFFIKIAAYDSNGKELWKNFKVHPIKDDPKSAFWYTLGDAANKPTSPPKATQVMADTRLTPNESRTLNYDIPNTGGISIIRAEALYDLLLPPIKANVKGKIPDDLLKPKLAASAEIRI